MPTISSLLRSAEATRNKIRSQEDQLAAFQWENSAQTYEDFSSYEKFLNTQSNKARDPSDKITYASKLRSARRSYTSNEIQRQQMSIMEGTGSTRTKLDKVYDLYSQAVTNGDYNLAQNLASQYDSLSIQAQNEAEASAKRGAGRAAASTKKELRSIYSSVTDGDGYVQLPNGEVVKSFKQLSQELQSTGGSVNGQLFKEAFDTYQAIADYFGQVYNTTNSQDVVDYLSNTDYLRNFLEGNAKVDIAGMSLDYNELNNAAVNQDFNNPLYHTTQSYDPATGKVAYKLEKNKTAEYQYVYSAAQGGYVALPINATITNPYDTLGTAITDQGEIIDQTTGKYAGGTKQSNLSKDQYASMSIQNRLANLGYQVTGSNQDGTFNLFDSSTGQTYTAVVQDGKVRYFGAPNDFSGEQAGLYEIDPTKQSGEAVRAVAPDETSDFGVQSAFGGLNSQATPIGNRAMDLFTGKAKPDRTLLSPNAQVSTAPVDLLHQGPAVITQQLQGTTTSVLQNANLYQKELARQQAEAEKERQAAFQLQAGRTRGLNQTVVRNRAMNGAPVRQLRVARPRALPTIKVAAPRPQRKIVVPKQPTRQTTSGLGVTISGSSLQGGFY